MKKNLLLTLLVMLLSIHIKAADGDVFKSLTEEGIEMSFVITSEANSTVRVGDGTNAAIDASTTGNVVIPKSVDYNEKQYNVTALGNNAFKACKNIETVDIPASVSVIGIQVFMQCSSLKSLTLSNSVNSIGANCFRECTSLSELVLSESITTIPDYSFLGCKSLQSVTLPSKVKKIGLYAFRDCSKLSNVYSRIESPFKFGSNAFQGISSMCGLHVPEGTKDAYTAIGWTNSVFKGGVVEGDDTPLKGFSFTSPSEEGVDVLYVVTDVDNWRVKVGDGSLPAIGVETTGAVTIPSTVDYNNFTYNVTNIATKAFSNCLGLEKVILPESLTSMDAQAFYECSKLQNITVRMISPFELNANSFSNISNYCGLHVPEGYEVDYLEKGWTKSVFKGGVVEGDDALTGGYKFTSTNSDGVEITFVILDIDEKTAQVGDNVEVAISDNSSETITIPAVVECNGVEYAVTTIGEKAFQSCTDIKNVVLPEGLKVISYSSFSGCTNISEIIIPSSVTSIENNAFNGCSVLTKVISRIQDPFTLNANSFSNINSLCGLHVPEGTKDSYVTANWTKSVFKGGVVEGDKTATLGQVFSVETEDGVAVTYVVTDVDNMYVRVGNNSTPAVDISTTGKVNLPSTVDLEGNQYTVVTIGNNAFKGCTSVSEIIIPESVRTIGSQSFGQCSSLTSILIPNSVTSIGANCFRDCSKLSEVTLSESITTIPDYSFINCKSLKSIVLPEKINKIGLYAFKDCSSLSKVYSRINSPFKYGSNAFQGIGSLCALHVPEGTKDAYLAITGWTKSVFKGGVVEGDNVLTAGETFISKSAEGIDVLYTIKDIDEMTIIVGSESVTAIGVDVKGNVTIPETIEYNGSSYQVVGVANNGFKECAGLTGINLPNTIATLGTYSFYGCSALKSIIIPSLVNTIPLYAFEGCTSLSSVTLPEGLTAINNHGFAKCESLKSIDLPSTLKRIGWLAFSETGLIEVTIPEGVTTLEVASFGDCYYLKKINLPSTLKKLENEVFRHDIRLTSVELPEGFTSMGKLAFFDCQGLAEITLPSTLEEGFNHAFYGCISLRKVISRMEDPFEMPESFFLYANENVALHIPDGTYDKYAAAGWVPEIFPGGIVYGDDTPTLNETFTFTTIEGVEVTAVLTDIEKKSIQVGLGTSGNPAIDQATQGIVTLPDTVEAFGQKYVITTIGGYAFRYCNDVTEVRMPATVTHIGRYGFGNMDNLEKAVLPDSLIAMETAAFYRDAKLSELKLNEGLQDIGNYSFSYAAISELEIPKTVTNIGRNSFAACENLDKVISRIETAYAFQDGAFAQISGTCGLHVPEGTKEAYIEQGWTEETFPGGIVYGDETLHKGQSFDVTEEDGTQKTFRVTDVNEMKAEMVSVKAGSEAGGTVTLMPTATHELTGNVYTVSSIADKAFGADVKKVLSRIETPFAVSSAAFASLSPMCSLHVPAGTKAAYLENGWTEESFKAGVVEGDDTLVKGQTFTLTDEDGTSTTYRVTDVNDNLVEIVSAKEGEEADGRVSIQQAVTDPVAGNDYTVASIGNGAFNENLKAVTAGAETPYPVTSGAFKGIGDKCVLFVPAGTKDAYIENGWTEDIFKGGIYEGNIPGDVNEDLAVDISDIVAVINTIADPENSTYRYADVNEDGKVDISDIVKIINIIAE